MWDFKEVRKTAIEEVKPHLQSHSCAERILFAQKYDTRSVFVSAVTDAIISDTSQRKLRESGIDPVIVDAILSFRSCILDLNIEFVKCDTDQVGYSVEWCKPGKHAYVTINKTPCTVSGYRRAFVRDLDSPQERNRMNRARVEEDVYALEWKGIEGIIQGLQDDDD